MVYSIHMKEGNLLGRLEASWNKRQAEAKHDSHMAKKFGCTVCNFRTDSIEKINKHVEKMDAKFAKIGITIETEGVVKESFHRVKIEEVKTE